MRAVRHFLRQRATEIVAETDIRRALCCGAQ
jgi:hypothetical protein